LNLEENPRTMSSVLGELADACGTPYAYNMEAYHFDANQLMACSNFAPRPAEGSALSSYTSEFGPILRESRIHSKNVYQFYESALVGKTSTKVKNPSLICRKLFHLIKISLMKQYKEKCRSEYSNLSCYQKAIVTAIRDTDCYVIEEKFFKKHKRLSNFANIMIKLYDDFERKLFLCSNHHLQSLTWQAVYDAQRMSFDLHYNLLLQSDKGGVGKSFAFDNAEGCFIKGTIEIETTRSDKAEFSNEKNRNGLVIVMHEVDNRNLNKNAKNN